MKHSRNVILLVAGLLIMSACAKNPVTGRSELRLVGEQWELEVGKSQYAPLRQSQGGDYVVDPQVQAYVNEVGQKLAKVSDRKLPYEFNVINSSVPNAWALPGGKISINRGLLIEMQSEAELAAVLGHEIVHSAARHGALAQQRGMGLQLAALGATVAMRNEIGAQGAQMLSGVGAQLITQSYSRKAERESDHYGMVYMSRAGYNLQGAVDLQETFVKLSQGRQAGRFQQMFSSHPASINRVKANRELMTQLPSGELIGKSRYRKVMARLTKSKPAYDAYDEANRVYKKQPGKALALVQKAIRLEPREAMFHSALGDIERDRKRYRAARQHYDKAIQLNDGYFYYHLRRGETNRLLRNYPAARRDLQRSIALLPTAEAHAQLGEAALAVNNRSEAIKQFKTAASDKGAVGQSAWGRLMVLDLSNNPDQYIRAQSAVGDSGTLIVKFSNPSPKPVTGLVFSITSRATGESVRRRIGGVLKARQSRIVDTGVAINQQQLSNIDVKVLAATLAQ